MSDNSKLAALSTNVQSNVRQRTSRRQGNKRHYAILLAAVAVPAALQVRNAYADISGFGDGTITTGWQFNGTAIPIAPASGTAVTEIQLTDAVNGQAGSAFFSDAQRIDNFTAAFHYSFLNGSGNPADGVAFVLQNNAPTAL